MIQTYWNNPNTESDQNQNIIACANGLDAMYQSYQIYTDRENNKNISNSIDQDPQMKIIQEYNMIDCKIMWDILNALVRFS
jgi:hypothetical protein